MNFVERALHGENPSVEEEYRLWRLQGSPQPFYAYLGFRGEEEFSEYQAQPSRLLDILEKRFSWQEGAIAKAVAAMSMVDKLNAYGGHGYDPSWVAFEHLISDRNDGIAPLSHNQAFLAVAAAEVLRGKWAHITHAPVHNQEAPVTKRCNP